MLIQKLHKLFLASGKVSTDSRMSCNNGIFFALKGDNFNGNLFAKKALDNGCAYAVVDEICFTDSRLIKVDDVLVTLQELAKYHRSYLGTEILAITGSNGKTTTKELINSVLSKKYRVLATKGNLNNHIGVPLTLLNLTDKHEIGIIEMGANHPGEINELCEIADPDLGIITNIGKAHLEGFGGFQGVVKTKTELYKYLNQKKGVVFYNRDNELLKNQVEQFSQLKVKSFGTINTYDFRAELITSDPFVEAALWNSNETDIKVKTHLAGAYNLENIGVSYALGKHFEIPSVDIKQAIENYLPKNARSQIIKTEHNTILMDAYNANPSSMKLSIEEFKTYKSKQDKVIILGAMKELGEYSDQEHQDLVRVLQDLNFLKVYLVGTEYETVNHAFNYFKNTVDLSTHLKTEKISESFILLKGSRSNKLETLLPDL